MNVREIGECPGVALAWLAQVELWMTLQHPYDGIKKVQGPFLDALVFKLDKSPVWASTRAEIVPWS